MNELRSERLRLRPLTLDDAPFILRLLNEPAFLEFIGDKGVRTLAQAEGYLRGGPLESYARHGHGLLAVELAATGEAIGMCGLLKRDEFDAVDLGYALLKEHWGRGYALEAARAVLDAEGRERVLAVVYPGNGPSIRLLEKLGFAFTGLIQFHAGEAESALYERRLSPGA